jgi:hypothetical protein
MCWVGNKDWEVSLGNWHCVCILGMEFVLLFSCSAKILDMILFSGENS